MLSKDYFIVKKIIALIVLIYGIIVVVTTFVSLYSGLITIYDRPEKNDKKSVLPIKSSQAIGSAAMPSNSTPSAASSSAIGTTNLTRENEIALDTVKSATNSTTDLHDTWQDHVSLTSTKNTISSSIASANDTFDVKLTNDYKLSFNLSIGGNRYNFRNLNFGVPNKSVLNDKRELNNNGILYIKKDDQETRPM